MDDRTGKVFVLVHGSFHGAWAFGRLAPLLTEEGHQVVALDLPGHGLRARFPRSYLQQPQDPEKLATEPSPLAQVSLRDCVAPFLASVRRVAERTPGREVVLVGHSFGGVVLNPVGEAVPELVSRLVYISAFMAGSGKSLNDYITAPEFASSKLLSLSIGDPMTTGAIRINPRSADPAYQADLKDAFAADLDDGAWEAAANLLTPDTPAPPHTESVTTTADRWGSIPRTYISTTADNAFPSAAQQLCIREADALAPANPTDVRELATSHSAYWTQPERLAEILLED